MDDARPDHLAGFGRVALATSAATLLLMRMGGELGIPVRWLTVRMALRHRARLASAREFSGARALGCRVGRWTPIVAAAVTVREVFGSQVTGRSAHPRGRRDPARVRRELIDGVGRQILHLAHRGVGEVPSGSVTGLALAARWRRRTIPVPARGLGSVPTIAGVFVIGQAGLGTADVRSSVTVRSPIAHLTVAGWPWACVVLVAVLGFVPTVTASTGPSPGRRTEPTHDARTRRSCSERASG